VRALPGGETGGGKVRVGDHDLVAMPQAGQRMQQVGCQQGGQVLEHRRDA
jgi:hypothetical protein